MVSDGRTVDWSFGWLVVRPFDSLSGRWVSHVVRLSFGMSLCGGLISWWVGFCWWVI